MKILIFAAFYHPDTGGYIKNVHELAKRLTQRGYGVEVVTCSKGKETEIDGVKINRLPSWMLVGGALPIPRPSKMLYDLMYSRHDIVITQTRFFATSLLGAIYAKLHRVPHIHTERGSCHSVSDNWMILLLARIYDHTAGSVVVKLATVNIGVSQTACDLIKHIGGSRTRVIYNGIDCYYHSDDHLTDICFVGRLIYAKGVHDLIRAFESCCSQHNNLRLVIVGDGVYRNKLEGIARRSRYSKQIVFYGTQSHENVIRIMASCDVFVNPSYSEGLPTSVMEAASLGIPIIATDVGGTSEIITHGESGILYPAGDVGKLTESLLGLLDSTEGTVKARCMGINALHRVGTKFAWNKIVDQYEDILKEVCPK